MTLTQIGAARETQWVGLVETTTPALSVIPEIFRYGDGSIGGNISCLGDSGSISYERITQHTEIPRMYRGLVLPGVSDPLICRRTVCA